MSATRARACLLLILPSMPVPTAAQRPWRDPVTEALSCDPRSGIVVCSERRARRRDRFRLRLRDQGFDPAGSVESVSRERHSLYEIGDVGTGSCSTVGPGGFTGCMIQQWRRNREQYGH